MQNYMETTPAELNEVAANEMPEIEIIPATKREKEIVKVAAYVRVSSGKDEALHSFEAQKEYYQAYVNIHEGWELVGIYADEGISGTLDNRPKFQQLLADCRAGKVDLVVTKSITRFARNTVILLETIRELKGLGIDCYFEKENMHSISPDGELLITLLAMYAEEEARSASENQRWRIRKRFEAGLPWVGRMLGYRLENGEMVIVPEEAEVVRKIFSLYLDGKGRCAIAKQLVLGDPLGESNRAWTPATIKGILQNEAYTGEMILQKTYREDFRTKKKRKNKGERQKYLVRDSHEAIIDKETFQKVQAEMAKRSAKYNKGRTSASKGKHLFCGLVRCGYCGGIFKYHLNNRKWNGTPSWGCLHYLTGGKAVCPSQRIPEYILIAKTKEVLQLEAREELTREILLERVDQIVVPEHNHLIYGLKNDEVVEIVWEHPSRSKSWTKEMRQAAREKALARNREGGKRNE